MENTESSTKISPVILTVVTAQIVFIIIMVTIIINQVNTSNKIEIRDDQPYIAIDSSLIEDIALPYSYAEDIAHGLTDTIALNTPDFSISDTEAIIRDDSLKLVEFNNHDFNALSFIVDIPNLEQSYQVYYKYPTGTATEISYDENPYAILCIENGSQIIYPNFDCHSPYSTDIRQKIATEYAHFLEFDNFTISIDNQNPNQIDINPATNIDDTTGESYIQETRAAIRSLGVSPNLFDYHIVKQEDLDYRNNS